MTAFSKVDASAIDPQDHSLSTICEPEIDSFTNGEKSRDNGTATRKDCARIDQYIVKNTNCTKATQVVLDPMDLPDIGFVVSGIAGRFPSADNMDELKQKLTDNCDMCDDHDDKRWPFRTHGLPPRAGRIKDISLFDAEFFGYTKESAFVVEHQLRILYEVIYESIIDSGVNPASLRGTKTGLFLGLHTDEFENVMLEHPDFQSTGYRSQLANTVAQYFDLRGQVCTFDLACASGFGAFHNAVTCLKQNEIEQAVVCAVNICTAPKSTLAFVDMQMVSPTGYSRFGDANVDGYVKSEACVSTFLQRKNVAFRNYSSILATRTNVDGYKKEGITFPSADGQETLIRETKELVAGLHSDHVQVIEAHGTGTPAGDPIECKALTNVYCPKDSTNERTIGPLLLGSSKSYMGHSEGASGLCSLAKVICMFENEIIYKSLHCEKPNPNIESLMDGRAEIVTKNRRLDSKIIPMSCYGFGGANVHAILRSNSKDVVKPITIDDCGIDLSATNEHYRLVVMFGRSKQNLETFFDAIVSEDLREKALTRDFMALVDELSSGPIDRLMNYRGFTIVDMSLKQQELYRSIGECHLLPKFDHQLSNATIDGNRKHHHQDSLDRLCYFVYPGLGSQWQGMALNLRKCEIFWSTIERLDAILKPFEFSLIQSLEVNNAAHAYPMIVSASVGITAVQIALTNILRSNLNIVPTGGIIGHSVGEIACAYADGVLDEREAILLAYIISTTLEEEKQHIEGSMVAVNLNFDAMQNMIDTFEQTRQAGKSTLFVSCDNGPESVTISGTKDHVEQFLQYLRGINCNIIYTNLNIDIALHNPHIMREHIKDKLITNMRKLLHPGTEYARNEARWFSSVRLDENSVILREANALYFASNLCKRVDFHHAINKIDDSNSIVIEIGPTGIFESIFRTLTVPNGHGLFYTKLMKKNDQDAMLTLFASFGSLYQNGINLSVRGLYPKVEFPVGKQVPSISSLLKWNHTIPCYIPKYPENFSTTSERITIGLDLLNESDKYLSGHVIEGRVLFPATGYLVYAWMVFSFVKKGIYDAAFQVLENQYVPAEFQNVRLHRAVIIKENESTDIHIVYDCSIDYFAITEGGQVVADGYIKSPEFNPDGLLYDNVARRISNEKHDQSLNHDDIYKQFRVNGYDYGETFRCIQSASSNGQHIKVKFNGHLIALFDNVLQSIFLSICAQSPQGALFLPTGFDYLRLNPDILIGKIKESGVKIEEVQYSNSSATRQITKEIVTEGTIKSQPEPESEKTTIEPEKQGPEEVKECIFDTYCDPLLGIIISDGIEMRGVKAIPVNRRELTEPILESYKFVPDFEEPVNDSELSKTLTRERYDRICTEIATRLIKRFELNQLSGESSSADSCKSLELKEIEVYLQEHLIVRRNQENQSTVNNESAEKTKSTTKELIKNQPFNLLSLLDTISSSFYKESFQIESLLSVINTSVTEYENIITKDILMSSFSTERFIRPIIETIIENTCHTTNKMTLLEINPGNNIFYDRMYSLATKTASHIKLEYIVAHPDPVKLNLDGSNGVILHTLKDIEHKKESSLLSLVRADRPIDAICLCDSNCYAIPMNDIESNGLGPILKNLTKVIREGGFLLTMVRYKLSFAERFIIALRQLGMENNLDIATDDIIERMKQIQSACEARIRLLESEAKRCNFELISKKTDTTGCALYLYKNSGIVSCTPGTFKNSKIMISKLDPTADAYKVIHLRHGDYGTWLDQLKVEFKVKSDENKKDDIKEEQDCVKTEKKIVWLCAVATKDKPINGIVGFVQCLRREIGDTKYIRCFFDSCTFKNKLEKDVSLRDIQESENFQLALDKNLFWNCISSNGQWGSYRHITLDEYFDKDNNENTEIDESHMINTNRVYANVSTRGDLSSFKWYEAPFPYSALHEEEKRIKVNYSALNFRDVMMATGRLPLDAIPLKLAMIDCLLGLEFSGIDIKTKKRVAGIIFSRSLATEVLCQKDLHLTFEIPDNMSLKDAVTMPVVYLTAIQALICRGKMQSGESILIHAGSGGVGQAAIRLALHHGFKVFTTVGSEEKRNFLLQEFAGALSPLHIFNSRDCTFETHIMKATSGRGVDLILNSLADDKLQASIRCLADNGRFLEIGKYDQAVNARLELTKLDTNKTFHSVHLDKLFDIETLTPHFKGEVRTAAEIIDEGIRSGYCKPIKHTCFPKEQIEEAFRFMATGKHIGKVLLEIEPENHPANQLSNSAVRAIPRFQLDPAHAYIVTGGLGGFGLELIKWLASVGGRHFVITSRTGVKTGYQGVILSRLEQNQNCKFLVVDQSMADGTTREGITKLFQLASKHSNSGRIGGLFHLAVVLKDSLLENMTSEDFDAVCKPKADACILLDEISRKEAPDMRLFVAFSSVSCGKGNAGQMNYGYANSVMERVCEQRRHDNLHGLAIQWGAIGDVGIAYETLGGNDTIIGGTIPQRMPSCFSTLAKLLCSPFAICSSLVTVDEKSHGSIKKGDLVGAVLHVLGIKDASKVDEQTTLGELGLDSLMAVEIRQYIEREYETTLNVQEIRTLTIARIREIGEKGKDSVKIGSDKLEETHAITKKIESLKQSGFSMSTGMDVGFKPPTDLPKSDCCRLNNESTNVKRPVFVLTHIHGSFERLEKICKKIVRPCIGLNYTSKLNKMKSFTEIAHYFFDLLENLDWTNLKTGDKNCDDRVVDLIGYSFGAVISYELLVLIQKRREEGRTNLIAGRYILLDMSPKLADLMGQMSGSFVESGVDEILIGYITHHAKDKQKSVDFNSMKAKMESIKTGLDDKFKLTCDTVSQLLNITDRSKQNDLFDTIEAFYRRYLVMFSYKSHKSYIGDATLIRAEEDLMTNVDGVKTADDYFLSEVINGDVTVYKFAGNHESSILDNTDPISNIINEIV